MGTQLDLLDPRPRWQRLLPIALERLKHYSELSAVNGMGPLVLAYSGGKDSDVILTLAKEAGIPYEAVYHWTTIDPPEVVAHVKAHEDVRFDRPKKSFYQLVRRKGLPSALRRWCCQVFKERRYPHRIVVTGVRWAESTRRAQRQLFESAYRCKTQRFLHAILEWHDEDVWGFLDDRGVETCSLYAEGWPRVGCVACPLSSRGAKEAERWPKTVAAIKRAWDAYVAANPGRIDNPERMWDRYIHGELGRRGRAPQGCPLFADTREVE